MRTLAIMGLALVTSLAGCESPPPSNTNTTLVQAVDIGGKPYRCLKSEDLNLSVSGTVDLRGDVRRKLLTPAAFNSGIRVYISSTTINDYGQVVLHYSNRENTCVLFSESISLQELGQRVGLNPVGISPFFEVAPPAKVATPAGKTDTKPAGS